MISQDVSILSSACLLPALSSEKELSALYKKYIPPMMARYCSTATKMALAVASEAIENNTIDYAIFCSEHGELVCGVSLLTDLSRGELLSPSDFSHSVHNTASGIFTMMHKMRQNVTSLASGQNTFLMGVVSALAWLKLHPNTQVLITVFDDHILAQYHSLNIASDRQYAVAFLLSNKNSDKKMFSVTVMDDLVDSESENNNADALFFYKWLHDPKKKLLTQENHPTKIVWKRIFV